MVKFYVEVFLLFFGTADYEAMCLIRKDPRIREIANRQVEERTRSFLEAHDVASYIRENIREWVDTHTLLAGRVMKQEECLPYVFKKLVGL